MKHLTVILIEKIIRDILKDNKDFKFSGEVATEIIRSGDRNTTIYHVEIIGKNLTLRFENERYGVLIAQICESCKILTSKSSPDNEKPMGLRANGKPYFLSDIKRQMELIRADSDWLDIIVYKALRDNAIWMIEHFS